MCFSAPVSFAAAAILGVTGAAALTKVRAVTELPLAVTPVLFAGQQAIEGFLWRAVLDGPDRTTVLATLFATIGLIVWPLLIPIGLALVERHPLRRLAILLFVPVGIGVSVNYAAILLVRPYRAWPLGHTLTYVNNHSISPVMLVLYILCVCLPPLLSASRILNLFGAIVIAGLAITFLAFYEFHLGLVLLRRPGQPHDLEILSGPGPRRFSITGRIRRSGEHAPGMKQCARTPEGNRA